MQFRPCIDIHNGRVKQIVGGSLRDAGDQAKENFVASHPAAYYSQMYQADQLPGGHVILLNSRESDYYEKTKQAAKQALHAYPGGMQVGGGIRDDNAAEFLDAGAYAVIVTSFVFQNGIFHEENLQKLVSEIGSSRIILDLSCRKKDGKYYIVTDRWQTFTQVEVTESLLKDLARDCREFLIHAADVEGNRAGIDREIACLLGRYAASRDALPVTYAGGIHNLSDIEAIEEAGQGHLDFTVGSALDLFGGDLSYRNLAEKYGR